MNVLNSAALARGRSSISTLLPSRSPLGYSVFGLVLPTPRARCRKCHAIVPTYEGQYVVPFLANFQDAYGSRLLLLRYLTVRVHYMRRALIVMGFEFLVSRGDCSHNQEPG